MMNHSLHQTRQKAIFREIVFMLEFAQMSEILDFSLCILRVHNLSDHERECGVVLRHHCVSFLTFLHLSHCSEFPGRVHHWILEPYAICALFTVAETLQKERGQ